jgi:integrase
MKIPSKKEGFPLFQHLTKAGRGLRVSSGTFNAAVKSLCARAGLRELNFTGHSMRAGGATAAAQAGVDVRVIKRHGGWKSDAVLVYIHDTASDFLRLNAAIGNFNPRVKG